MFSALTGLFSSLSILPAADVPLHPQLCTCPLRLPAISATHRLYQLEELCKKCGNLQSVLLGDMKQEDVDEPFPIMFKVSSRTGLKSPRRLTREPTKSEVQYLNDRLTASLASISSEQVLVARKGELVVFENGESLYKYQAVDLERILAREAEGKGPFWLTLWGAVDVSVGECSNRWPRRLGKTVVLSALICLYQQDLSPGCLPDDTGIAPSIGILQHWKAELKRFAPKLQVLLYHGDRRKTSDPRILMLRSSPCRRVRNQYAAYTNDLVLDDSKFMLYMGKFKRIIIDSLTLKRRPEKPRHISLSHIQSIQGRRNCEDDRSRGLVVFSYPRLHDTVPVRIELTPAEREVYRYIQFIHPFKSHWAQFVRLRQAADHPALLKKALHRGDIGPKLDDTGTSDQMRAILNKTCAEANKVISQDRSLSSIPPGLQAEVFEETYVSSKSLPCSTSKNRFPREEKTIIFSHFLTNLKMIKAMFDRRRCIMTVRWDHPNGWKR
ncbi:hypothetical protein B0H14DRAFT_3576329 [Mycena olivaceomarginata]|nr:hypothetical protein B0H14DRAFT_3576329 [Mycena olivaceomarginata]